MVHGMFKTVITLLLKVNMQISLHFKRWGKRLSEGVLPQVRGKTPNILKKFKIDLLLNYKVVKILNACVDRASVSAHI